MPLPFSHVVQRRQVSVSKRVRSMHVALSPFDGRSDSPGIPLFERLPVELRIEIFTHCQSLLPRFDAREAPLLITRVSHGWRALVLSVPKLWSSFEIEVTGSPQYEAYLERSMKLWLARSKNCPLTASIYHISIGKLLGDISARLLALLIPEAHRWRSVQFNVPSANMISLPSHFPLLESLGLKLMGLWTSERFSIANIPWCQLSRLDLELEHNNLPTLGDTFSILSRTCRLKQCKIDIDCTLESGVDFHDLHLPVLEECHLILHGGNVYPFSSDSPALSLTKFLDHISMPTLRALTITWLVERPTVWPNRHLFMSFLRRISPTLKSLELSYLPVSEPDLVEILMLFSKVTHLRLRFSIGDSNHDPVSENLLSLLSLRNPSDGSYPLLPSLTSLDLQCQGSHFSNSALFAMVMSRWKRDADPGDAFNHFGLLSMKPLLREVEKQTYLMRRAGLDIVIETLSVR